MTIIESIVLRLAILIGGKMLGSMKLEKWVYSDNKLQDDIIINVRDLSFYDNSGVPTLSVYIDIQNKTLYKEIEIQPAVIDIDGFIKLYSASTHLITKNGDKEAIRFESILNTEQKNNLFNTNNKQLSNKGRGQLTGNVTLAFQCDKRKIYIGKNFPAMKLEGI